MIDVIKLQPCRDTIAYLWDVATSEEYLQASPDFNINDFIGIVDQWRCGFEHVYCPAWDGKPMGLCHGHLYAERQFVGHYIFFRHFWNKGTVEAALACIDMAKADTGVSQFIGIIPKVNRASTIFSIKMGFEKRGEEDCPRFGPCWKMIKEI